MIKRMCDEEFSSSSSVVSIFLFFSLISERRLFQVLLQ